MPIRKLEAEAQALHAQAFEIGERNIFPVSTVKEAKHARRWFLQQVKSLQRDIGQHDLARLLNSCIDRAELEAWEDRQNKELKLAIRVTLNIDRIFEIFQATAQIDLTAPSHFSAQ